MDAVSWFPIGVMIISDEENNLHQGELVYLVNSASEFSLHRMSLLLRNEFGPLQEQLLRLSQLRKCIKDPNSLECVIHTQSGRLIKIAKEHVRMLEPHEFQATVLSYFVNIDDVTVQHASEFLYFFGCATSPYIDAVFVTVSQCIMEAVENLRSASFIEYDHHRQKISMIFQAFLPLLHHRCISLFYFENTSFIMENLAAFNDNPFLIASMTKPEATFSEEALSSFENLLRKIQAEQAANPIFYCDEKVLMNYIMFFRKVEGIYNLLYDVAIVENAYRNAAARKVPAALEQFYENKQQNMNEPYFLNVGRLPEITVISFIRAIINAPRDRFDSYANAFCFFLCLEPCLTLALKNCQFHEFVIPILNNALMEAGSTETFETLLAKHSVSANLEQYYVYKMNATKCTHYKEKMFTTLTYRKFGHLTNSSELTKVIVLAPPADYDKNLYGLVTQDMRITVRSSLLERDQQLEAQVPFDVAHKCYQYNGLTSLRRDFLKTWQQNDSILKEHILKLMENEEMHLAKFVTELIHDSEDNARVIFQIILETNKQPHKKIYENVWHTGVCWHLLIVCLKKCAGVQSLFPEYAQKVQVKFGEAMTSMISLGTLKYYWDRLKGFFNEKQQNFVQAKLEQRIQAEECFSKYINALTDYTIDTQFKKYTASHGYVFFTSFIYRFMNLAIKDIDLHQLEKDLIIFRDTAAQVIPLRSRFADMNLKKQMRILLCSVSKQLPKEHINHIFTFTWAELHARDMIGKTVLEQFDEASIEMIKELGEGLQAKVFLARVPKWSQELVAKIANDPEKFQEISGELDSLMRTLSHPQVLRIFGYIVRNGDYIGIVMEYCKGGTLQSVINDPNEVIDEERVLQWAIQAASGLLFFHKHNIIHRDVKPDNMLLDAAKTDLKISDLGLSKILEEDKSPAVFELQTVALTEEDKIQANILGLTEVPTKAGMTSSCGTDGYRAPEIFDSTSYTEAVDVFSLGRSIWHMIYRVPPSEVTVAATWGVPSDSSFIAEALGYKDAAIKNCKQDIPLPAFNPSIELKSIAARMMHENVDYRLTMEDAYNELRGLYMKNPSR